MTTAETQFACEYCGQSILAESVAAGHSTLCPSCGRVVTVPSSSGTSESPRDFQSQDASAASEAAARIEEPPRENDLAALRRDWFAVSAERDRLHATAAHQQAESKSFQSERLALRSELAQLRQVLLERERQLGEWQGTVERLGTDRLVLENELTSAQRQLDGLQRELGARDEALAGVYRKLAQERTVTREAREETAALQRQIDNLTEKLALATEARESLAHTAEKLRHAGEKLKVLEREKTGLKETGAQLQKEMETLRRDLTRTDAGKQLLELRKQLRTAVEEEAQLRTRVEELDALLQTRAQQYKRLEGVLAETRTQFGEALRKAESVSDERLKQDNT
ncbi:MAG: hypothetical protein M3463_23020, partial [Verrucomicrobiota bacterium]|nr:hypothetical protein [Verrucomicrobiota bacterium]